MWAAKFIDVRTGAVHSSYRRADGTTGSVALLDEARSAVLAALPVLERKADAPLVAAVRARPAAELLRVAIWLDVDVSAAEAAVEAAHPEVEWLAGRPIATTLEQARALRAELWEARRTVYAAAAEAVEAHVTALGGTVAYASTSAPLVFVDLPGGGVAGLAERPEVLSLGLEQDVEHVHDVGRRDGRRELDWRQRRPGQRRARRRCGVRQRLERRRPRRPGRPALQHQREHRDRTSTRPGSLARSPARARPGAASRPAPTS